MRTAVLSALLVVSMTAVTGTVPVYQTKSPSYLPHRYGAGRFTCGAWVEGRRKSTRELQDPLEVIMTTWAEGFLSAATLFLWAKPGLRLKDTDESGIKAYLDKYCAEHPLDAFSDATTELVGELKEE
jgi:hypothetical protein